MANQSHSSGHQGQVTDPAHDGRLKENRDQGVHKDDAKSGASHNTGSHSTSSHNAGSQGSGHTPGAVRDPEHDGRLKENRASGTHKGDK